MEIQDANSSSSISSEIEIPFRIKRSRRFILSSDETSDETFEVTARHRLKSRRIVSSTETEDEAPNITDDLPDQWINPRGNQPSVLPFIGTRGITLVDYLCAEEEFYLLFVTEEMFEDIAEQTNIYAMQVLTQKRSCRLDKWIPTNKSEIKKLFGLLIWMGLVKLPEINLYWSKDPIFAQNFPPSVMPRNRFEILLRMLHFVNNENANPEDRLTKMRPIIDKLKENFAKYYDPPEMICIDESIIPFRGRVVFKQYMKQKKHRYGVKLFKLCFKPGYTYNFQIYCGQQSGKERTTPKAVVMTLCQNIFDKGHTLCVDNWYSSIDLAEELIARNTHLIGTIRSNRKRIPKEVVQKKLRRGEIYAKERKDGITLMKWKDKRDVLLVSTKHSVETAVVNKKGYDVVKPKLVIDYNEVKSSVDVSDQMAAYSNPLRKTIKWYKKVAFELFLNTSVINAWILFNTQQHSSISIVEFRKRLVNYLCYCEDNNNNLSPEIAKTSRKRHEIKKQKGKAVNVRKRCASCYKKNVKQYGTEVARQKTKRVVTFCSDCPNKPFLCIPCFKKINHYL
ncbi:PiggyBac transposable element-derived protein 4 [Anthophora retusa]